MRRSVREALVGFSIIGAIAGFAGTMLWLRGVRLGSESWTVTADFANAGGLAARSPVTFRGIMVGTVRSVDVTPMSVKATLEINADDLQLPLPVKAAVSSASLLGGDSQVELVTSGAPLVTNSTCESPPRSEAEETAALTGKGSCRSSALISSVAFTDIGVTSTDRTVPTMIPRKVTGERAASPPALAKSAVTVQDSDPRRTPLSHSMVPANPAIAPMIENPTRASRTLRRMAH
mgnify:CR=1 FL=1